MPNDNNPNPDENAMLPSTPDAPTDGFGDAALFAFMSDLRDVFTKYDLIDPADEAVVAEERAAAMLLAEVHEWFREGRIDTSRYEEDYISDDATWVEFCRAIVQANLDADERDPTYPDGVGERE